MSGCESEPPFDPDGLGVEAIRSTGPLRRQHHDVKEQPHHLAPLLDRQRIPSGIDSLAGKLDDDGRDTRRPPGLIARPASIDGRLHRIGGIPLRVVAYVGVHVGRDSEAGVA